MNSFSDWLDAELTALEAANLRRRPRPIESPQAPVLRMDGREVLNFSSNDYLGLAAEPVVVEAAREAAARWGAGAGAARLISGNLPPHRELEERLAAFKRTETAITFSCGYAAAVGTLSALAGAEDVIILDKLCHACLIDGARLSGAVLRVFPHNHLAKLESHLRWARAKHPRAKVFVVTESVFSMDGDQAPLAEVIRLKDQYDAILMLDEAHAIGVLGDCGRGLADELGINHRVEIQMGTLGKALGSSGGYIAGDRRLTDFLLNRARSYVFSTAPPPAAAASASRSLEFLESKQGTGRREALWRNLRMLAVETRRDTPPASAIVPIHIGDEAAAMQASRDLLEAGCFIPAVRYPTVARGAARLRLTLSATHSPEQIAKLAAILNRLVPRCPA